MKKYITPLLTLARGYSPSHFWCLCQKLSLSLLYFNKALLHTKGFPGGSEGKASACDAGDLGLIPGSGRSPGEGNDNPLQYLAWKISWTEKPGRLQSMESQSQTWLSDFTSSHKSSEQSSPRPLIEFFSSRGQKSQSLCSAFLFSNNLSIL